MTTKSFSGMTDGGGSQMGIWKKGKQPKGSGNSKDDMGAVVSRE
jgi:hypothetical protein